MPCLPFRLLTRLCLLLALWITAGSAAATTPLRLDGDADVAAWPALTLWLDADPELGVEEVLAQPQRFAVPQGTPGNLGRAARSVWLRIPVRVDGDAAVQRVLDIDYPPLNHVDLYLVQQGRVQAHFAMGNALPLAARALPTRSHAAHLSLAPGTYELLLRVHSQSSLVLPITLRTPQSFAAHEARVQLVQGLVFGLVLFMFMYSVVHGVAQRDRVFLDYALMLVGNTLFTLANFGIGTLYLWPDWPLISTRVAPLGVLLAVAAGSHFVLTTLAVHEISRLAAGALRLAGASALLGLALALSGLLDYRATQGLVTVLGLAITFIVPPVAFVRARRGDRVAAYLLGGWLVYLVGAVTAAGILRGLIEPTWWAQHVYPLSMLVEMSAWMAILGMRLQHIQRAAERARAESDSLRALAHTDPLTGLLNRRGLELRLGKALQQRHPRRVLAVFMLDLDGFKPINDRWGHGVGDALLAAVGQRLQEQLRGSDIVARVGGDEFVVLADELADAAAAQSLGQKLLAAFAAPFDAAGARCEVGATVGYALVPQDGASADELIGLADAAMYAGKQAGRRRLLRTAGAACPTA